MTELQQYTCPLDGCSYGADNPRSVASHIQAKTDPVHKGEKGADHWEDIEKESVEGAASTESGDGGGAQPVEFPTAEGASSGGGGGDSSTPPSTPSEPVGCCGSPDLEGEGGDVYQLSDGTYIQLEPGDQICVNCDSIHE